MARNRNTENETVNEVAAETAVNEVAAPAAEKMVTIMLPLTREESGDVFVSVNERRWLIKRGEAVEVPECVAEVIRNQEKALRRAIDYIDAAAQKADAQ